MSETSESEALEVEEEVISEAAEETEGEVTVVSEATAELEEADVEEATADLDEADEEEATADKSEATAEFDEASGDKSEASAYLSEATAEESEKHTEESEEVEDVTEEVEEEENEEPVETLAVPAPEEMESQYLDVRKLPLRPPQPLPAPDKAVRRPWHPVMWDSTIIGVPLPVPSDGEEVAAAGSEYPHKQRIRNLKRAIRAGKVKPTAETLIFFLCNKFAVSEERQNKVRC